MATFTVLPGGSIQAAVNAASDGDTIVVSPGVYNETVTVDKDVTIQGPNAGTPGSGTRLPEAIVNGGFYITDDGVTIDGMRVDNGSTPGGVPAGIHVNADNVTITNNVLQGDAGSGEAGIITPFVPSGTAAAVTGLVISNNLIDNWFFGYYLNPTTGATVTGNLFSDNNVGAVQDDLQDGSSVTGNSFLRNNGDIGYGVADAVENVGAQIGPNTFDDTTTPNVGILAYGPNFAAGSQDITGTAHNDSMREEGAGVGQAQTFHAGAGNDRVLAGGGNDTVEGGAGNDDLNGGAGTDTAVFSGNIGDYQVQQVGPNTFIITDVNPGDGNDGSDLVTNFELYRFGAAAPSGDLSGARNFLVGGPGNDRLEGGDGDDQLFGLGGNDALIGNAGNDRLDGGDGNDLLDGGTGNDLLDAGAGDDYADGGPGNDTVIGGPGNDVVIGCPGDDYVDGGPGNDTVIGCDGNDSLNGGAGDDYIDGQQGNDGLFGGPGNDSINGSEGDDYLVGGGGNDSYFGGDGADSLNGGDGADYMVGGAGNDGLFGGFGNDTLIGGTGQDWLVSGNGSDIFLFQSGFGLDTVVDFDARTDVVNLDQVGNFTFADVMARASQQGNNTVIDFGGGNVIIMKDIQRSTLVPDDFAL